MFAIAALITIAAPAVAVPQDQKNGPAPADDRGPGPEDFEALGVEPDPTAESADSTGGERQESERAHNDLSSAEALALLSAKFESLVEAEAIPELELAEGQTVDSYPDEFTALIDVPGAEAHMLAESTLPLQAPEAGTDRPVDGELVSQGDHFEAANAPVEAEISADLSEGIVLDDAGVSVSLGTDSERVREASDKIFYPNVETDAAGTDTDTDILVTPTAAGAEVAYQLRSVASPEEFTLSFDMPPGAQLRAAEGGGAEVRAADATKLVEVAAPVAFDAEGTAVPVSYRVSGAELVVVVKHRDRDLLRPIVVDPAIESYYNLASNQNIEYWQWLSNFGGFTWSREWDGLQNAALAGYSYPQWSYGQFRVHSIRESFIERVNFYNFDRYTGNPATCTFVGIFHPSSGWWERGTVQNEYGTNLGQNGYASQQMCDGTNQQINNNTRYAWVGWDPNPEDWVYDSVGSNGNFGVFGLNIPTPGYRYTVSHNRLRSATIFRYDYNNPAVAFSGTLPPTTWRDDNAQASRFGAYGTDAGLGMKSFRLKDVLTGASRGGATHSCTGRREAPCPYSWSADLYAYLLEGRTTLALSGVDVIGHEGSTVQREQRIDRTPPNVQLSGALSAAVGQGGSPPPVLYGDAYDLKVIASDGATSSPSAERSGVKSLTISVDGSQKFHNAISCPNGSCGRDWSWTFRPDDYPDGLHTVLVSVSDQLGHVWQKSLRIEVDRRGDIYHARKVTDDPAAGGKVVQEEWASPISRFARSERHRGAATAPGQDRSVVSLDEIITRRTVSCDAVGSTPGTCGEVRALETTRFSDGAANKVYSRHRGNSANDARLPTVAELLDLRDAHQDGGAGGPLSSIKQAWQTLPPAAGDRYVYTRTPSGDGSQLALDLWTDEVTGMPVRARVVNRQTGAVLGNEYWDYEPRRLTEAELPSGFFSVARPSDATYSEEVDADSAGASLGPTRDNDTGAMFTPYDLGDEAVLQLQMQGAPVRLCLSGVDVVRFTEPSEPARSSGAAFEEANPGSTGLQTFVASNYSVRSVAEQCPLTPPSGLADVQVLSTHAGSQYGRDARSAHDLSATSTNTALSTDLSEQPLVGPVVSATQTVKTGNGSTSTWVELAGPSTVLVQGEIDMLSVPGVISGLRPR